MLKLATIALATFAALCGAQRPNPSPPIDIDVAVAGLGLAGAELMTLAQQSGRVPVAFESRSTFGGRTQSIDVGGVRVPKGGGWQQGTGSGSPLSKRITECGISTRKQNWNSWLDYGLDGSEADTPWGDFEASFACAEELSTLLKDLGFPAISQDTGLRQCGWRAQSVEEQIVQTSTNNFEWAETIAVSGLQNTKPWKTYVVYRDEDQFITDPRGSEEMVGCWLDKFGIGREASYQINYNSPIVNINTDEKILTLQNGTRYRYNVLFNTLSLGVLSWNQAREDGSLFTPPLSLERSLALHSYHTPIYQKIFFQFASDFWNGFAPNQEFYNIAPNSPHECTLWQSLDKQGFFPGSRILYLTCTSPQSDYAENLDEEQWKALLMPELRKVFGQDIPEPENVVVSNWLSDPNFRGTYSNRGVESNQELFDAFFAPLGADGSHIFTGEAYCSDLNGYMHSALLAAQTSWCEYRVRIGELPANTPCRQVATDADGDELTNYCFVPIDGARKRQESSGQRQRLERVKSSRLTDEEFNALVDAKLAAALGNAL